MNFLVFLDTQTGDLEKILSGTKSMVMREFDPARIAEQAIRPGDHLYFLRAKDENAVRVTATVVRAYPILQGPEGNLSQTLKELQHKLQLSEVQYNYWSAKKQVLLVEFESARKIPVIQVAVHQTSDRSSWIAFESFNRMTGEVAVHEHE